MLQTVQVDSSRSDNVGEQVCFFVVFFARFDSSAPKNDGLGRKETRF